MCDAKTINTENNTTTNSEINVEVEPIEEVAQPKFNWRKFGLYAAGTIAVGACATLGYMGLMGHVAEVAADTARQVADEAIKAASETDVTEVIV